MPPRGSAQFLLHFFHSRHRLGWTTAAIAGIALAAGLLLAEGVPILTPAQLAQVLRENAWERALAGLPEQGPWPWASASERPRANVPRLGVSALMVDGWPGPVFGVPRQPDTALGEVAIGDHITVTTASGSSRVYRVTGRKVIDPHLAESGSSVLGGDAALVTCQPLDPASSLQLVIQAITADPPAPEPKQQQKL